jgi:hypothetical protein
MKIFAQLQKGHLTAMLVLHSQAVFSFEGILEVA